MSNALPNLADLPPDVQAYIAAQTAALVAERTAHSLAIQNRDTIIADLGKLIWIRTQMLSCYWN